MKRIERQGMKNGARTLALFLSMLLVGTGLGLAKSIQLGLHAGISIPNIQGGNNPLSQGYSSRLGPFFGIFADFSLAPHLSLRTELNYSSKGGKRNGLQPTGMDPHCLAYLWARSFTPISTTKPLSTMWRSPCCSSWLGGMGCVISSRPALTLAIV